MSKIPTDEFIKAIQYRRTVYPLTDKSPVSDARIEQIVQEVVAIAPSAYNTQPMRVALMLGGEHKKLWQLVREKATPLLAGAPQAVQDAMAQRFTMFEASYGSVCLTPFLR